MSSSSALHVEGGACQSCFSESQRLNPLPWLRLPSGPGAIRFVRGPGALAEGAKSTCLMLHKSLRITRKSVAA